MSRTILKDSLKTPLSLVVEVYQISLTTPIKKFRKLNNLLQFEPWRSIIMFC